MGFPYQDPEEARAFLMGFLERLKEVEEIHRGWAALDMVIAVHLKQPDLDFWVDARGGAVEVRTEPPDAPEGAALTLTADVFHELYTGRENVMMAFAKGKIKPKGRVQGILQLARTMPLAVREYQAYLSEKGRTP